MSNVPNLDCMESDDLRSFAVSLTVGIASHGTPIRRAREIFPERPKGYSRAAKDLGNYAWNKLIAMELRRQGRISRAIGYEDICERIYSDLPEFARW